MEQEQRQPDPATAANARPFTGRPSNQLFVNHETRKPLFSSTGSRGDDSTGKHDDKDGGPRLNTSLDRLRTAAAETSSWRRTSSESRVLFSDRKDGNGNGSGSGNGPSPSSGTRIPKPFSNRRTLSLADAFRMAEEEEGRSLAGGDERDDSMDASPSPAPRTWRSNRGSEAGVADENRIRDGLGKDHLDTKGPQVRPSLRTTQSAGTRTTDTGRELARVTGNEGPLRSRLGDWRNTDRNMDFGTELPALVPGIEDVPLPSVETGGQGSPEKSFNWQVDQDFTAGDLQVSDSPRIKVGNRPFADRLTFDDSSNVDINSKGRINNPGSQNTKLDEIYSREKKTARETTTGTTASSSMRPSPRPRNTKLDEIGAREKEAEQRIPIPDRHLSRLRANKKLDEIKQREEAGLSKRQMASAMLDEIRDRNAMSGSVSPGNEAAAKSKSAFDGAAGQRIPDTPVTVYKNWRSRNTNTNTTGGGGGGGGAARQGDDSAQENAPGTPGQSLSHARAGSQELLRRLARAASSSPAPDAGGRGTTPPTPPPKTLKSAAAANDRNHNQNKSPGAASRPQNGRRSTTTASWGRNNNGNGNGNGSNGKKSLGGGLGRRDNHRPQQSESMTAATSSTTANNGSGANRPSVGFAGLRRVRSSESTRSKRSSMHSDDPTDRIEAEMKLFAPIDNYSEKGSVRAPSPEGDDDEEDQLAEATPRPKKQDPLTMPTPKITGAFVETPVAVKVERKSADVDDTRSKRRTSIDLDSAAGLREARPSLRWRNRDADTASDPGSGDRENNSSAAATAAEPSGTNATAAVKKPRARSLPRRRPPIRNSAKPLSVKDDLRELRRTYNIEDSTLEDLGDFLPISKSDFRDSASGSLSDDEIDSRILDGSALNPQIKIKVEQPEKQLEKIGQRAASAAEMEIKQESDKNDSILAMYDRMMKKVTRSLSGIHTSKKGIDSLHDEVTSQMGPGQKRKAGQRTPETMTPPAVYYLDSKKPTTTTSTNTFTYIYLPVPRLYHRTPTFHLTLLGMVVLLLSSWYAAESSMCALYCRPTTCTTTPCIWSYDDPTFGVAIPVKLDQWATDGLGRHLFNAFYEEAEDWLADVLDAAKGVDISQPGAALLLDPENMARMSFEQKRKLRRRLRKKGVMNTTMREGEGAPEVKAKWDAWHQARMARERAREVREMSGWTDDEMESSIGQDERVW